MIIDLDSTIKEINENALQGFRQGYCIDCLQEEVAIFPDEYKCMICELAVSRS